MRTCRGRSSRGTEFGRLEPPREHETGVPEVEEQRYRPERAPAEQVSGERVGRSDGEDEELALCIRGDEQVAVHRTKQRPQQYGPGEEPAPDDGAPAPRPVQVPPPRVAPDGHTDDEAECESEDGN